MRFISILDNEMLTQKKVLDSSKIL